ncbi:MAG: 16S rRNA (cytosine(1402)-N(4))-methyltransferase RsmH [Clostridia bacterium]|nr:16S rRNA (cytosine(1402)-N(4))-methyltransferase RsmH [Clostridia bacterium]MBO7399129.1 16S rRNA (cytosine(1402)-N(4))-methyltransferase RsmH [Clostridia bacterium]MBP5666450.1 16S rRNA (cytosine(1402)-N(4))-methyltransferase RsmH [Clostridia bacterium]MBP5767230.1 16S rRNA (cytosine(1402)-N(4))-methyltransferase RsmH [Clostridia bacterium]
MSDFKHVPVLLDECMENLQIKPDGTYVDGTVGGGGHSGEILKKLGLGGFLIGIDRDAEAIEAARSGLDSVLKENDSGAKFTLVHGNYVDMVAICRGLGVERVDGILLDLGVSSHQFDTAERGFSYRFDAPLDMRMNREDRLTAAEVVNTYSERALSDIIYRYGEERWAKRIASFIVEQRKKAPIETTFQLVDVIKKAIPKGAREDGHPAKKTFQAIRIEVNGELDVLAGVIGEAIELLKPGGVMEIITFHSLEEGIVKKLFKKAENPCTCPPDLPVCVCGKKPLGKMITRSAILPTEEEIERNPRAKSAKLRVFKRGTDA